MNRMLDCFKAHDFSESECAQEVLQFSRCVEKARVSPRIEPFRALDMSKYEGSKFSIYRYRPGCSKLTTSLVNISLKFQTFNI